MPAARDPSQEGRAVSLPTPGCRPVAFANGLCGAAATDRFQMAVHRCGGSQGTDADLIAVLDQGVACSRPHYLDMLPKKSIDGSGVLPGRWCVPGDAL